MRNQVMGHLVFGCKRIRISSQQICSKDWGAKHEVVITTARMLSAPASDQKFTKHFQNKCAAPGYGKHNQVIGHYVFTTARMLSAPAPS